MSTPSPIQARLERAFAQHQRGQFAAAEALYREILGEAPRHGYVLHMLGVVQWQQGRHPAAIELLRQAVAIEPANAAVHSNLGLALHANGDYAAALASCDHALALVPSYPEALNNRGNALQSLGRPADALASYSRALALRPEFADAHYNRGRALEDLGRIDDAAASYGRALALQPDHAEALYRRGNLLHRLGHADDAIACYDRALALRPDLAVALNNRGNALLALGRTEEALGSYERALVMAPDLADAHSNRGNVLRDLGRLDEALQSCEVALRLDPGAAGAFNNRGNVLLDLGRPDEALADFERALALQPELAEAHTNRGNALGDLHQYERALASHDRALTLKPGYPLALSNRGKLWLELRRYKEALADFDRALERDPVHADALNNRSFALCGLRRYDEAAHGFGRLLEVSPGYDYVEGNRLNSQLHCCDWTDLEARTRRVVAAVRRGERAVIPFFFLATSTSPADQLRCAQTFVAVDTAPPPAPLWRGQRYAHERIRVAYLSADFHEHATAYLMAELFEIHDRQRFEITGVSFGPDVRGAMRERLQRAFDVFVDAREMTDGDVARWMREREIDIAVDLKGYTDGSRLGILAHRPAPVQVNYLGFPGTMGVPCIDYIVADPVVIPAGEEAFYTEQVVRLPDCYQVNDTRRGIAAQTPSRRELGLPEEGFVFCCFNNNYKILPEVYAVWMRLLAAVPGSVLWLLEGNAAAAPNLRREAASRGVAPERLVFAPRLPLEAHLARHRRADLFLDTLPYNAHTTASDALWAGLPVLTCAGSAFAGRVGASLVRAAGLPELVTRTLADYEAQALQLARAPDLLASLRAKLARQRDRCALFDTRRFCAHLESAYATMRERSEAGLPPAGFAVPPADVGTIA